MLLFIKILVNVENIQVEIFQSILNKETFKYLKLKVRLKEVLKKLSKIFEKYDRYKIWMYYALPGKYI